MSLPVLGSACPSALRTPAAWTTARDSESEEPTGPAEELLQSLELPAQPGKRTGTALLRVLLRNRAPLTSAPKRRADLWGEGSRRLPL